MKAVTQFVPNYTAPEVTRENYEERTYRVDDVLINGLLWEKKEQHKLVYWVDPEGRRGVHPVIYWYPPQEVALLVTEIVISWEFQALLAAQVRTDRLHAEAGQVREQARLRASGRR